MNAAERWDDRLEAWAQYMLSNEHGAKVKISSCYSRAAPGRPAEGDGIPIYIGEVLDTHELVRKLPEHLYRAVWVWYVETGTLGEKAHSLAIHRDTLSGRVSGAKLKLEDLHRARRFAKAKTLHAFPQSL